MMINKPGWRGHVSELVVMSAVLSLSPAFSAEFIIGPAAERFAPPADRNAPPPVRTAPTRDGAASALEKARSQRGAGEPTVPLSTIVKELDDPDSPFAGRPGAAATENLNRARAYQQGADSKPVGVITPSGNQATPVDVERLLIDPDSNRGRLKSNLDRAKAYQRGESPGVTNARMGGREDLPFVDCGGATQNVAGRIGNDSGSGQVVVIMKGEHGVKVRCR